MINPESRYIVLSRHGELENQSGKMYARDSVSKPEDIMHINALGVSQMNNLGKLLLAEGFHVVKIRTSPATRAQESSYSLSEALGGIKIVIDEDLDDVNAPGPYLEGMTMKRLREIGGNVYDKARWGKYNHETGSDAITRMGRAQEKSIQELKNGEAEVLMSHGDSIAWYLNTLNGKPEPNPQDLRNLIYPAKGEATIIEIEPDNKMAILNTLPKRPLSNRRIY